MEPEFQSPFNALPKVVVGLAVLIGGLEIMFQLATQGLLGGDGGVGWRLAALSDYAVRDVVWQFMVQHGVWTADQLVRFVTYPLIHTGLVHALLVIVFVLAMGKMVAEVFHPLAVLAVFWVSAIAGALAFVILLDSRFPLTGGYAGAYGLIGAFTYLIWVRLGAAGDNQMRAFSLIAILMAIQILFGLFQGDFGNVVAEMAGFIAGFLVSFLISPGGWQRLLDRLRQR